MKKVLVPTDFSSNSKAGLRFAIQWSRQEKIELVFVHIYNLRKSTDQSEEYYLQFAKREKTRYQEKLEKFVEQEYKKLSTKPGKYSCVVIDDFSIDLAIMEYCRKNRGIAFICIATRGAGKWEKILGTHTGNLITKSTVPVIAIPKNYKLKTIANLLYATDFANYKKELQTVTRFARPLKASVEVLHLSWPGEITLDEKLLGTVLSKQFRYPVKIHFKETDITKTLVERLNIQIRKFRPSVIIMFTDQSRNLFHRIFFSSKAEELSFGLTTPLLVFNKT